MKTRIIKIGGCLLIAVAALFGSLTSSADTVYVSYKDNNIIEKFDLATGADLGVFANTGLSSPLGLAFDSAGNLYAANYNSNTIEKFSSTGTDLGVFASTDLNGPTGLAFDSTGNLYVTSSNNNTIVKFTPSGVGSVFASSGMDFPWGLAFDGAGNLFVSNLNSNTIEKFSSTGIDLGVFASGLNIPLGLAFDSAGNLYVVNNGDATILKFTPVGVVGSVFANTGSYTSALAFDSTGNLYVTHFLNNTIQKFSSTGTDLGVFASTGFRPLGIVISSAPTPTPTPTPFPGGGNFVIGDGNAVVGNHVTFWGAQWAKSNSLSGGPAPSSFKGFADSTSSNPPACGGSWISNPGNSSGPPSSIGPSITVIVASSVTKSGSAIAGNIPEMVIIQTDPGYAPNAGHAGTGTVTSVICP